SLLPACGEKGHAALPCPAFDGGRGLAFAACPLRPACGEKVAGRPDEGRHAGLFSHRTKCENAATTSS
ncbi:hypothetical protein CN110_29980, partial [Sinorhizobium meliloti]